MYFFFVSFRIQQQMTFIDEFKIYIKNNNNSMSGRIAKMFFIYGHLCLCLCVCVGEFLMNSVQTENLEIDEIHCILCLTAQFQMFVCCGSIYFFFFFEDSFFRCCCCWFLIIISHSNLFQFFIFLLLLPKNKKIKYQDFFFLSLSLSYP